ncbi:D-3-phosphoglycerate dehydrogenase [Arthroderma uncinatum]|uniref:D-3-phosphoglycerate dehydrogenase n=1 Tax=Arthroderma uncinatum TaxID=74035 RepID=UPI00144A8F2D|nr:D-3-phosphoglycerate dehydrogenase [Arthroderma uncinatum]KAF3484431.1 D-3-phosphoglycerate dehydrogenase [Arthroderma uncinatum]
MASAIRNDSTLRAKVLVPEKLSPDGLSLLKTSLDVDERKGLSADELLSIIPDYEALLVRSETKVTAAVLQAAKKLKVVARAGVGVDNIDVEAATKNGIVVVNSPSGNIGAAAEHTIALLMSMARNIPDASSSLKSNSQIFANSTVHLVGLIVARLAKGLGMKINAVDPYASSAVAASASVTLMPSLSVLLPTADFLTIHTPLIASTKGMISTAELAQMKSGSRILNVARGGTVDEPALLAALESGHIAGAAVDVFATEPPSPDSASAKLIAHPRVIPTPHLGASTVEAQENVSIDVCEQVLQILGGALPRSAVNAPLILPEEYKKLQPFVRLVEKLGSIYTQHYGSAENPLSNRSTFDLIYEGEISGMNNTKPLFAALIKGLTSPISNSAGLNVNIVNAELVARERGIIVNEKHSRDNPSHSYSSLITLVATAAKNTAKEGPEPQGHEYDQIISGTCSESQPLISRLDRFATSFVPEGTLLICHNFDSPGKIGVVGSILGKEGVNINFMSVAPVSKGKQQRTNEGQVYDEALMILGVDKAVDESVAKALVHEGGVLSASVVSL